MRVAETPCHDFGMGLVGVDIALLVRHRNLARHEIDVDLVGGGEFEQVRLGLLGQVEQCLGAGKTELGLHFLRPGALACAELSAIAPGSAVAQLPEAEALAAASKRIRNILRKAEGEVPGQVDEALLSEPAELALAEAVAAAIDDTGAALDQRDYVGVLSGLARLRPQVDAFFDQVLVNAEDPAVRGNRLALLKMLGDRFGRVAAIEHLSA